MYVFCCGMHRSASTWQYMVASDLVESRGGSRAGIVNNEAEFQKLQETGSVSLATMKMHTPRAAFARALESGRAVGIYSFRDVRDVVFSLMKIRGFTFEEFVKREGLKNLIENDYFWQKQPRTLIQSYDFIVDNEVQSVHQIALHLNINISLDEAEKLAARYSKDQNTRRAGELKIEREKWWKFGKSRSFDSHTLLHENHITNSHGSWRHASPMQKNLLAECFSQWLIQRGFEENTTWAIDGDLCPSIQMADDPQRRK